MCRIELAVRTGNSMSSSTQFSGRLLMLISMSKTTSSSVQFKVPLLMALRNVVLSTPI